MPSAWRQPGEIGENATHTPGKQGLLTGRVVDGKHVDLKSFAAQIADQGRIGYSIRRVISADCQILQVGGQVRGMGISLQGSSGNLRHKPVA